jgi:hypothetical protein
MSNTDPFSPTLGRLLGPLEDGADDGDDPARLNLNPALIVLGSDGPLEIHSFEDLRRFEIPAGLDGSKGIATMVANAGNRTEMTMAVAAFAAWARKSGVLVDRVEG